MVPVLQELYCKHYHFVEPGVYLVVEAVYYKHLHFVGPGECLAVELALDGLVLYVLVQLGFDAGELTVLLMLNALLMLF